MNECDKKPEEGSKDLSKEMADSFLKRRKLFLFSGVDDKKAEELIKSLMYLDQQNQEDITLFINSPGGVISSGMAIYDTMKAIKSDVVTVVCGQAASMGAFLLSGGTKGKRFSWANSRIMIHQPLISGHMWGPASDIQIQAEEMLRIRTMLNKLLADQTGKTEEQIERDTERDNFMTAEEAKAYGLVDHVRNLL